MAQFFIPGTDPDNWEEVYGTLAKLCGRDVPPAGERVYSITFTHEGEVWTATVGETLRGSKTVKRGRSRVERTVPLSNRSTVMAIFPDVPFLVWHDGEARTWANPFLTGEPVAITRFSD
jgi:hypothetical protein